MARHTPGMATMSENNGVERQCNHLVLDAVKFSVSAAEVGVSESFEHLWFAERRLNRSEPSSQCALSQDAPRPGSWEHWPLLRLYLQE